MKSNRKKQQIIWFTIKLANFIFLAGLILRKNKIISLNQPNLPHLYLHHHCRICNNEFERSSSDKVRIEQINHSYMFFLVNVIGKMKQDKAFVSTEIAIHQRHESDKQFKTTVYVMTLGLTPT